MAEYPIVDGPMPETPTPLMEYQTAIAKLEFLLATSTPGPWRKLIDEPNGTVMLSGTRTVWDAVYEHDALIADGFMESATPDTDLELIVIGHASHTAQLQLLRAASSMELELGPLAEFSVWQTVALATARAINGATS